MTSQWVDLTVTQFADALASDQPAPGGGAAAAVAGALGAALAAMVAGLTVGRARYRAHHEAMTALAERAAQLKARLLALADADAAAYTHVTAAYQLPSQTEPEWAARAAAIEVAMQAATQVPLLIAEACLEALTLTVQAAVQGNRHAGGDAAVGALLAHAGLRGTARNVRINLSSLHDETFRATAEARAAALLSAGDAALARALAAADARAGAL